jgi:predicted DNA-binding ribbon-helix-helix protein
VLGGEAATLELELRTWASCTVLAPREKTPLLYVIDPVEEERGTSLETSS